MSKSWKNTVTLSGEIFATPSDIIHEAMIEFFFQTQPFSLVAQVLERYGVKKLAHLPAGLGPDPLGDATAVELTFPLFV